LYAVDTDRQFVENGRKKQVIVVGADKMSSITDYTDRTICVLFGDGAGAVLLESTIEEMGVIDSKLQSSRSLWCRFHMGRHLSEMGLRRS
jgi:3-oxoacyl-[acyl-carrier-protein] synthase-3